MRQPPLAGPVDLLLTVTGDRVRLTGPGIDVAADHGGVRPGLAEAVNETRRSRARVGLPVRAEAETQVPAGELLAGPGRPAAGRVVPARASSQRAGEGAGGGGAGASAGAARPGRAAGAGRAAVGGPAQPGRPRPAGAAPAGQPVPQDGRGGGRRAAGAAADRGRDRRPRRPAAGRCWITSGNCATCWPRSAPPARTPPTCGWSRSPPRRRSGRNWTAARRTCCTSPGTAPPASWTWKTTTARPGRSPPMSSWTRRSRRGGCRR